MAIEVQLNVYNLDIAPPQTDSSADAGPAFIKEPEPPSGLSSTSSICSTVDFKNGLKTAAKTFLNTSGLPPLHSGVVFSCVQGQGTESFFEPFEIAFGGGDWAGSGVWPQQPKQLPPSFVGATYRESVEMGVCHLTKSELVDILVSARQGWPARSYNLLKRNCNHFASHLCELVVGKPLPKWINKLAQTGATITDGWSKLCTSTADLWGSSKKNAAAFASQVAEVMSPAPKPSRPPPYAGSSSLGSR